MAHDHPSVMSPRDPFALNLSKGGRHALFALSLSKGASEDQAGLRQAQPERMARMQGQGITETSRSPFPFALSLSKGESEVQTGLRQAQPERVTELQPERVTKSRPERIFEIPRPPLPFALSLSKGGRDADQGLRQAQPERVPEAQAERRSLARQAGFTLIELMVVLAIIALLSTIVAPRYFRSVQHAREVTLRTDLNVMRDAIDKFLADQGRYPKSLTELQERRYIRDIPEDPITDRRDSWLMLPPPADSTLHDGMADVRSGAAGTAQDGTPYRDF